MTHLVTYLLSHGFSPVEVIRGHSLAAYRAFHAGCSAHHHLTAWALYHGHTVIYCYTKGA